MRKRCAIKHGIFKEFLAEFLGTFVLVVSSISSSGPASVVGSIRMRSADRSLVLFSRQLFGCGSVAQTVLSRNTLGEPLTVHIGFSVGLMMAAYVAGGVSGRRPHRCASQFELQAAAFPRRCFVFAQRELV